MGRKLAIFSVLLAVSLSGACVDGHAVSGTRPGHEGDASVDGGADVDGGGDGDGDGDGDLPDAGPPPPSCDVMQCEGGSGTLGEAPPCCTADDHCGLDTTSLGGNACIERDAPGPADSSCPSATVFGFIEVPGCCARGGKCGHTITMSLPLGCVPSDIPVPIDGLDVATTPPSCSTFTDPE